MRSTSTSKRKNKISRIEKLQKEFDRLKVDALIIENPLDLFYLTSLKLSLGTLIVTKKSATLFVDGRYIYSAKEKNVVDVSFLSEENLILFLKKQKVSLLGFDASSTTVLRYERLKRIIQECRPCKLLNLNQPIKDLRLIKDQDELVLVRKSAKLLWKGFQHIKKIVKAGMRENEVAAEFEIFCRKEGAEKLAFEPIIAFGHGSSEPHHRAGTTKIKDNGPLLVDIGVVVDGYHSDMTRVLFLGKVDPLIQEMYLQVKKAQKAALALCRPGIKIGRLDEEARKFFAKEGVEKHFLHSLGHGLGLEIHESPKIRATGEDKNTLLQPGMVITIEPGLYLPKVGGVRYEDTVIITDDGYENLYPKEE